MQITKSLDKVVAIAGGCLVFATGGGSVAAGAGMAGSGASMLSAWLEEKAKHGPESKRVLAEIRKKVRIEFGRGPGLSDEDEALLEGADYALGEVLLECIPTPPRLADAFGHGDGFATAAAAMVLAEVAAKDDLFAEAGQRAEPLARRFAAAAIKAGLETALTNRNYFAALMPFVLDAIKRDTGAILGTIGELRGDVRQLMERFGKTPVGRQAQETIKDSRPFVVLARKINQEVDDPRQALTELTAAVEIFLRQQNEAAFGTNLGESLDAELERIAQWSRRGEFGPAAQEAERAFEAWQRDEAERRSAERQTGLRLIKANIDQNILLRDPAAIALWVERRIVHESDGPPRLGQSLRDAANEWRLGGERKGSNLDLEVSTALARRALQCTDDADARGSSLTLLGNALLRLGERDVGTERLKEAVKAHRTALKHFSRERAPLEWASAQNCLGIALLRLGEREGKSSLLKSAVAAFRAALREWTRERAPFDWAKAKNNLGNALQSLGEREDEPGRFEEAVALYRAVLEEWTRERVPLDWAMAQNNLGTALHRLGQEYDEVEQQEAAVVAFKAALEEWTRERVPLDWARTQTNLGAALCALGEREAGNERLEEAVAAYRAALGEETRERAPFNWANTQYNLGGALLRLGKRETGTARLEEAVSAYGAALSEQSRAQVPLHWAKTQNNLGNALAEIGRRESGTVRLEEAATAYRAALEARGSDLITSLLLQMTVDEIARRKAEPAVSKP